MAILLLNVTAGPPHPDKKTKHKLSPIPLTTDLRFLFMGASNLGWKPIGLKKIRYRLARTQRQRPILRITHLLLQRNSQHMKHRSRQIVRADRRLGGIGGVGVRAAINLAAAHSAAGHEDRLAETPV